MLDPAVDPLADAWRNAWRKPDRRPIYEWAREHVVLPSAYSVNGQFNPDISRHLLPIFDALQDDRVRRVTVMKPTRGGGSLIADVWCPWLIANDPGPTLFTMNTKPVADAHAAMRVMPIFEGCGPVNRLFPDNRHEKKTTEIIFRNGMFFKIQGPSIGNLQAKGIRYEVNDEIWCWPPGRHAEALARLDDFEKLQTSKAVDISQGGEDGDAIDTSWKESTQEVWSVPCQACGHLMPAIFRGERTDGTRWGLCWDTNEKTRRPDGRWVLDEVLKTVRFECRSCKHQHLDTPELHHAWNLAGKYVSENPEGSATHRGFRWTAIICRRWSKLVRKWLKARDAFKRGDWQPWKEFLQKDNAECFTQTSGEEEVAPNPASYDVKVEWPDEKCRLLTVDPQPHSGHWWVLARAWGLAESRLLGFWKCFGWAEIDVIQKQLGIPNGHVLVDSGWDKESFVCIPCSERGWVMTKGEGKKPYFTHKPAHPKKPSVRRYYSEVTWVDPYKGKASGVRLRRVPLIHLAVNPLKDIFTRMRDDKKSGFKTPIDLGEWAAEYKKQIFGEYKRREPNKKTGREEFKWHASKENHAFDLETIQVGGAMIKKVLTISDLEDEPSAVADRHAEPEEEPEEVT